MGDPGRGGNSAPPSQSQTGEYLKDIPVVGESVPIDKDTVFAELAKGKNSNVPRPSRELQRVAVF